MRHAWPRKFSPRSARNIAIEYAPAAVAGRCRDGGARVRAIMDASALGAVRGEALDPRRRRICGSATWRAGLSRLRGGIMTFCSSSTSVRKARRPAGPSRSFQPGDLCGSGKVVEGERSASCLRKAFASPQDAGVIRISLCGDLLREGWSVSFPLYSPRITSIDVVASAAWCGGAISHYLRGLPAAGAHPTERTRRPAGPAPNELALIDDRKPSRPGRWPARRINHPFIDRSHGHPPRTLLTIWDNHVIAPQPKAPT